MERQIQRGDWANQENDMWLAHKIVYRSSAQWSMDVNVQDQSGLQWKN